MNHLDQERIAALFSDGNYTEVASSAPEDDWRKYAALGILGADPTVMMELGKYNDPSAQFFSGVVKWIAGDDDGAISALEPLKDWQSRQLLSLIKSPRIRVIAQTPWDDRFIRDSKFEVRQIGIRRTIPCGDGRSRLNHQQPEAPFEDVHQHYDRGAPPAFYFCSMIEWHYLPYNLSELPCPIFGATADYDVHLQNILGWLPQFDEIVVAASQEWREVKALSKKAASTFIKQYGISAELPMINEGDRPIDLFVSGTILNSYHPDKARLFHQVLKIPNLAVRFVDGFQDSADYFGALNQTKVCFSYVRRADEMPTRAIEALAMGCLVLVQKGSSLLLMTREGEGVLTYDAEGDGLGQAIRDAVARRDQFQKETIQGARFVRREFEMSRITSQYLRFLTFLATKKHESRTGRADTFLHQKRGVMVRGFVFSSSVNAFQLKTNLSRWMSLHQEDPTHAINMAREATLYAAWDLKEMKRNAITAKNSEFSEYVEKESAHLMKVILEIYEMALARFPKSLVLAFNFVRTMCHLGTEAQLKRGLEVGRRVVCEDPSQWTVDVLDDVFPWDFYGECFNYRAYFDDLTKQCMAGEFARSRSVSLILASIHYYLGRHLLERRHLESAVALDDDFPFYKFALAKILVQSRDSNPKDTTRALEILKQLIENSLLFPAASELMLHWRGPEELLEPVRKEVLRKLEHYRALREVAYAASSDWNDGSFPELDGGTGGGSGLKIEEKSQTGEEVSRGTSHRKVLLIPLEFVTWSRARSWSYTGNFAFEEGLEENGIECFVLPAFQEFASNAQGSFLRWSKELCRGQNFDQVWIWVTHNDYDPQFLEWVAALAPVRVAVLMESLEHSKSETIEFPNLIGRREYVFNQLRHVTHVLTADESDVATVERELGLRAMWYPPMVPGRCIDGVQRLDNSSAATFFGALYGSERVKLLNHPLLRGLVRCPSPPESRSDLPLRFDSLNRGAIELLKREAPTREKLITYVKSLRQIRRAIFTEWQQGLRMGCATVNLPTVFKSYAGRVIESMASGVPVISWKVPDRPRNQALFADGVEILLFDRTDPEKLARHIRMLQTDSEFARTLAANAMRKVEGYHTSRIRVKQILDWIEVGLMAKYGEYVEPAESKHNDVRALGKSESNMIATAAPSNATCRESMPRRESPENTTISAEKEFVPSEQSEFYTQMFVQHPYWSTKEPNEDETARWAKIRGILERIASEERRDSPAPLRILDVGCGRGWLMNLAGLFGICEGVEPVFRVVEHGQQLFPHLRFHVGTTKTVLGAPNFSPYDIVISSEVIEHIPDNGKSSFVGELRQLLRPGGYLIITTPRREAYNDWIKISGSAGQPVEDWLSEEELGKLFLASGFSLVARERVSTRIISGSRSAVLPIYQVWGFQKTADPAINARVLSAVTVDPSFKCVSAPMVSVVVPTLNRREMLGETLASILRQTYQDFEIIVVNDGGEDVSDIIDGLSHSGRIQYVRHNINQGLAASRNTGLRAARGKYIAYLDDDDIYYVDHLKTLVGFLESTGADVAYTDAYRAHQELVGGKYVVTRRDLPYSCDFDPDRILIGNFIPVLCFMHRKACVDIGGLFDEELRSHEDWELWIRMSRRFSFHHIKSVTCEFRWRQDGTSMSSGKRLEMLSTCKMVYQKSEKYIISRPDLRQAREKYLENYGVRAAAEASQPAWSATPTVSIIIPVFNRLELTRQCLESLKGTVKLPCEVIVVDNCSSDGTKEFLGDVANRTGLKVLRLNENFGFARACNEGALLASGDKLVFLNNDIVALAGWLEALVQSGSSPDVGAVGAKLLYPDGRVQHAGVGFVNGVPDHPGRFAAADEPEVNQVRELDMVTGACLLIDRHLFLELNGFEELYRNGVEDIDLCLRVRSAGLKVVYEPKSVLYHYEGQSAGRFQHVRENLSRFFDRWGKHFDSEFRFQPSASAQRIRAVRSVLSERMAADQSSQIGHGLDPSKRTGVRSFGKFGSGLSAKNDVKKSESVNDSVNPDRLSDLLRCADTEYQGGNFEGARRALEEALILSPENVRILSSLGAVCYSRGDYERAKDCFRNVLARQPNDVQSLIKLAHSCLKMDDVAAFEDALGRALDSEPENREALKLLADLNLQNGRFRDAAQIYTKIVTKNAKDLECLLALGVCFFRTNDFETARTVFDRVLEIEPGNQVAAENLEAVRRRTEATERGDDEKLEQSKQRDPDGLRGISNSLVRKADEVYQKGDFKLARELLLEAGGLAHADVEVLAAIGSLSFRMEDFTAAEQFFRRAAVLQPANVSFLIQLAMAQVKLDQVEGFERSLSRALELEPRNRDALKFLADVNFQAGRFKDAARAYMEIVKDHATDTESLMALGVCFFKSNDFETAQTVFERILTLQPENVIARENLAAAVDAGRKNSEGSGIGGSNSEAIGQERGRDPGAQSEVEALVQRAEKEQAAGNFAAARNILIRANDVGGDNAKVLKFLGAVCFGMGDYEAAVQYLRRAAQLSAQDASIWVQLAIAELQAEDVVRFEEALGRALQLDPKNRDALKFLADLNQKHGNLKDAAQAYVNLLRAHPGDIEAMLALGDCFVKLGDSKTAETIFKKILELEPGNSEAVRSLGAMAGTGGRSDSLTVGQSDGLTVGSASAEPVQESAKTGVIEDAPKPVNVDKVKGLLDQATFFNEVGNREAAIESLEEALELAPNDVRIVAALGNFYFTIGDYEASRERFRRAIELRPRDPDAYTRLAMACLKLGRIPEMESALGLALELDPDNREALKFLAKTNLENDRVRDAGRLYAKLLEKKADDVESMLSLGLCFYRGGDIESARMVYQRVLEAEPNNLTAQENLAALEKQHGVGLQAGQITSKSSGKIKKWLEAAEDAFGSQNLAGARDALKSALELMPESSDILAALGSICFQLGEMSAAREYLERLVKTSPADPQKWVELALAHYQLQEIPEFERALAKALDLDPENVEALRLLAHLNFNHGSVADAAQTYGRILKQTPNDLEILLALGVCFFKTGDTEAAKMMFERVLELDPENPLARNNLRALESSKSEPDRGRRTERNDQTGHGSMAIELPPVPTLKDSPTEQATDELIRPHVAAARDLVSAGKIDEARGKLREAAGLAPEDDKLMAIIGSLSFQLEDWDACARELARAVELCPQSPDYHTRLAMVMLKLDRVPEFEAALAKALQLEPAYRPALKLIGDLNLSNGRYEDAARTYNRLLQQAPDDIEILLPLGVSFYKAGDSSAAKMVFERILELDPKNVIARQNLRLIKGDDDSASGSRPPEPPVKPGPPVGQSDGQTVRRSDGPTVRRSDGPTVPPSDRPTVRPSHCLIWEGSQFVHHSLALINRELCLQLVQAGHHVSIIPYEPDQFGPEVDSRFGELAGRVGAQLPGPAEIHVRHQWPLNFQPPREGRWVVIQPWEFGSVPRDWVPLLRDYVDELWVPTGFVRECYTSSGVPADKIHIIPNGINPALFRPGVPALSLSTRKRFKFLFVGGTIHRKGADILLGAYLDRFNASDDVCLVIKDFGAKSFYQGQTLEAKIKECQRDKNAPQILYFKDDLLPEKLPELYAACNCLVHPYRGEGFGLPVLEAMACGLPVIVTAGGATDEFVQDAFAFRIPAERKNIGRTVGSFELAADGWLLEPDRRVLGERMVELSRNPEMARRMGVAASKYAHLNWTWEKAAEKVDQRLQALAERTDLPLRLQPVRPLESKPLEVPPAGRLGTLRKVHELLERKKYLKAWNAALEAIALRPFHPDAYLQMVDIALSADDEQQARVCADRLLSMTPEWDMAKKVHASLNAGQKLRKSRIKWTPLPPIRSKPRISVCLIAKNEEDFIGRCLASVKPIAHQIVVVDTGSSDRTVEIAKEHGAEVFHFAWNDDFSDARNAAHEHARGDWVLILDADEELPMESHENLWKDVAQSNVLGLRIPICNVHESSNSVTYVPRLFRNAPALFFVGRVHEQIYTAVIARKADWSMEARMGSAMINHYGYDPGLVKRRQKIQRNLRLMEKAVEEMPNEAALLMNYGLDLVNDGRLEEGLEKYRAAVRAMTPHPPESVLPEVRERLVTIFGVHLVKAGRFEELLELVTGKLARDSGPTASMHFLAGVGFIKLERPSEAIGELKKAVEKKHIPTLSPPCHELDSAAPHHLLAECLAKQGESVAAEEHYKLSLQIDPQSSGLRHDYAHFLHKQDRSVDALKVLHGAVADGIADERIWHLGSFITNSRPELLEFGVEWTEEAVKFWPAHEAINWLRAEVLFKSGRLAEGAALMQRTGRSAEPSVQAAVILSALVNNESLTPVAPEVEAAISREFVGWYRRLLASGAQKTLAEVNQRIAALREALPSAAGMLEQAISEANKPADS